MFSFLQHLFTVRAIQSENKALESRVAQLEKELERVAEQGKKDRQQYQQEQRNYQEVIQRENEVLREELNHKSTLLIEQKQEIENLKQQLEFKPNLNKRREYDPYENLNK